MGKLIYGSQDAEFEFEDRLLAHLRVVVPVPEAGLEPFVPRISLTLPALASSRHVLFLVTGAGKRTPLARLAAGEALRHVRRRWEDTIRPHVRDRASLDLVMLVSDGLYFNNALDYQGVPGPVPSGAALDALIELVVASTRA